MRTPVLLLTAALAAMAATPLSATAAESSFRVVTTGLGNPYEIAIGQDGFLWATERTGHRVLRINPRTGQQHTAATVADAVHTDWGQDGVLGMALHPASPHVFVAYTYDADPGTVLERKTKIVRFTNADGRLHDATDVITGLPGEIEHQAGRLTFGPDRKLYFTVGDQSANQGNEKCKPIRAQQLPTADEVRARNWTAYSGKVLRLELDGSIPMDNPVLDGVRSHVHSYGHRNPQGLVFGPTGTLYSSEHGHKTDDEVNVINRGKDYGWPHVAGYRDDNAYVYGNWSAAPDCAELVYGDVIPPSVPQTKESEWQGTFVAPIKTFHTVPSDHDFTDEKCAKDNLYYLCWPTVAPSSLDHTGRSLLMPTLKEGTVYQLVLNHDGTKVTSVRPMWRTVNRYRDTAVSPDGRTVYVATDSSGRAKDADGVPTTALANPGSILEFTLAP
nr:glucose/sorbosone family PQQ-dependent dehydrogenase [Kibdelosporangium sp. MJ126-NF4]CEL16478.1 hypothetical protein [Kibdelosporangium sp. MJ126-NF4]CTQ90430.1 hypothetical protein [Kibdelosporangium sp. MJ126-NF4]